MCLLRAPSLTPFFLTACVVWWTAARRENFVARAAYDCAVPVLAGLTLVCVALAGLDWVLPGVAPARVHAVENTLADARLRVDEWTHWSLGRVLIVGSALLVLGSLVANLEPVARFKRAQVAAGFAQTVLLVLIGFPVYAQVPLQRSLDRTHARVAADYRAALDREWRADATTVAASTIRHRVSTMTPTQVSLLTQLFTSLDEQGLGGAARDEGVVASAFQQPDVHSGLGASVLFAPVSDAESRLVDKAPTSVAQLDRQITAATDRTASAARAETSAAAARQSAAQRVVEIGLMVAGKGGISFLPLSSEPAKIFVDDLIDRLSDWLEPRIVRWFEAHRPGPAPT